MAIVWKTPQCILAFNEGLDAAARGSTRNSRGQYASHNEKAAFNDGWDSFTGIQQTRSVPAGTPVRQS